MEAWAWAVILAILSLLGLKVSSLVKDKGKSEAEKKAREKESERADELSKRLADDHDINTHFGVLDSREGKDSTAPPRFEIPPSDRSDN
jgi:hypothetical protein